MSDHRYRLTYEFQPHPEGVTKDEVPDGRGACDAFLFASILRCENGDISVALLHGDGRTGEGLGRGELASVGGCVAKNFSEDEGLAPEVRAIFGECFARLQSYIRARTEGIH